MTPSRIPVQRTTPKELSARLDRKGFRVICGLQDCGADIAAIVILYWFGMVDVDVEGIRCVCFTPDWYQRKGDGVWVMSDRATKTKKKVLLGIHPQTRRPLARRGSGIDKETGERSHELKRPHLPAKAKCPSCGFPNTLRAEALGSIDPRSPLPIGVETAGALYEDDTKNWEDWSLHVYPGDFESPWYLPPWFEALLLVKDEGVTVAKVSVSSPKKWKSPLLRWT